MQTDSPLADYLISLANTEKMRDHEALPSHEYRFRGLGDRVTGLLTHHEERLDEIASTVTRYPESTAWEITRSVTWSRPFEELSLTLSRLALRETHAHLVVLQERGVLDARVPDETATDPTTPEPIRWFAAGEPIPPEPQQISTSENT